MRMTIVGLFSRRHDARPDSHAQELSDACAAIDPDEVIGLAQELVRIDSSNPPGNEQEVAKVILDHAVRAGLQARLEAVTDGRANFGVHLGGTAGESPRLVLCGHLDTVVVGDAPWPFGAEIIPRRGAARRAAAVRASGPPRRRGPSAWSCTASCSALVWPPACASGSRIPQTRSRATATAKRLLRLLALN